LQYTGILKEVGHMKVMMRALIWGKYGRRQRLVPVGDLAVVLNGTSLGEVKSEAQRRKTKKMKKNGRKRNEIRN
jgi:hypothetical protein